MPEQGFEKAGKVSRVDNQEYPDEEFCGTRLDVVQEIYVCPEKFSKIYVKYDSGYAAFERQNAKSEDEKSQPGTQVSGTEQEADEDWDLRVSEAVFSENKGRYTVEFSGWQFCEGGWKWLCGVD